MNTWHQGCRVSKTSGKYTYIIIPNVLEAQYGCKLLPMGVTPPKKASSKDVSGGKHSEHDPTDDEEEEDDDEDSEEEPRPVKKSKTIVKKRKNKRKKKADDEMLLAASKEDGKNMDSDEDAGDDDNLEPLKPIKKRRRKNKMKNSEKNKSSKAAAARSNVWKHCTRVFKDGCKYVRCNVCMFELKTGNSFSTTPAINHLHMKHQINIGRYANLPPAGAENNEEGEENAANKDRNSMKGYLVKGVSSVEAGHLCVEMIAMDLCPVSILDRRGLKQLLNYLNPVVKYPSRYTVRKMLLKARGVAKAIVKESIKNVTCSIHGTTDAWSSSAMKGFMSLTLSYVDENFVVRRLPADVVRVKGRHTAVNMSNELNMLIEDAGLKKLCTITTDSASNQIAAAALSVESGHVAARLPCAAHVLNLAARKLLYGKGPKQLTDDENNKGEDSDPDEIDDDDEYEQELRMNEANDDEEDSGWDDDDDEALLLDVDEAGSQIEEDVEVEEIVDIVKKLRRLMALMRKSQVLDEAIARSQQKAREESKWKRKVDLRVLIDVKTRWSSTYVMIQRALILRDHIEAAKCHATKDQRRKFMHDDEWEMLEEFNQALEPFSVATRVLSGSSYVTSSRVLETWKRLVKTLRLAKEKNKFHVCDKAIDALIGALEHYWDKHMQSIVHLVATALDPVHKKLKLVKKERREKVWERIAKEGCAVATQLDRAAKSKSDSIPEGGSEDSNDLAVLSESDSDTDNKGDNKGDNEPAKQRAMSSPGVSSAARTDFRVTAELAKYRGMVAVKASKHSDPLAWWRKHQQLFPILSVVARSYLGAAASSVESERIFSLCGHLSSGRRSRLGSGLLSAIVYLNSCSKIPDLWSKIKKEMRVQ